MADQKYLEENTHIHNIYGSDSTVMVIGNDQCWLVSAIEKLEYLIIHANLLHGKNTLGQDGLHHGNEVMISIFLPFHS